MLDENGVEIGEKTPIGNAPEIPAEEIKPDEDPLVEIPPVEPEEDKIILSKEEYESLKKREQDAENYKKENEKYRKQGRIKEIIPQKQEENQEDLYSEQNINIQNDFYSKREDVLHEMKDDIQSLEDNEWQKIKPLLSGAINSSFENASKEKRYVARGEIKDVINGLISYAKGESGQKKQIEKARIQGIIDQQKMDNAEISGIKSVKKPLKSSIKITEEDKEAASESGLTPERIAEIRSRREKLSNNWEELYK
ncbi:MAG: hypothetical protein Q8L27_04235 [archaeon]|nr:hypothetical protein [archaeon]